MFYRSWIAAMALSVVGAAAFDESKYPDWKGQWRRAPGIGIIWDETKPRGLAQQPPLAGTRGSRA
jgi:hypothetical protein